MRQDLRIIVEGMDGAGKTTLVNKLIGALPEHKLELVRNPHDDKQDFVQWWPEIVDRPKSDIIPIHDRFFFSEIVYGPILRGHINAPEGLVTNIALFLRATSLLIFSRPRSSIILDAIEADDHIPGVFEKKRELVELYDNVMAVEKEWFGDRFLHYDWNNYEDIEYLVMKYLEGGLQ